jgi:hypothetical protein
MLEEGPVDSPIAPEALYLSGLSGPETPLTNLLASRVTSTPVARLSSFCRFVSPLSREGGEGCHQQMPDGSRFASDWAQQPGPWD